VNRLLIVVLFSTSALFSMEEAPMVNVVPPRKLRLTKLYQQLKPQHAEAGYHEVLELVSLPQEIVENSLHLQKLRAEQSSAEEIAEVEEKIGSAQFIIQYLQIKFDKTQSARERYRFSK